MASFFKELIKLAFPRILIYSGSKFFSIFIPNFDFGKQALKLDNVNYADLTPVLEVPNNDC